MYKDSEFFLAALKFGNTEVVGVLLRQKADVNRSNIQGETPLLIACQTGNAAIAKMLIDAGADIQRAKSNGEAPLWVASYYGHEDIVDLLLSAGAQHSRESNAGITPLEIASKKGHEAVIEKLKNAGALPHQLSAVSLINLHNDELVLIFKTLSLENFVACTAVCRKWRTHLNTDYFWEFQFITNYPFDYYFDNRPAKKDELIKRVQQSKACLSIEERKLFTACKILDYDAIERLLFGKYMHTLWGKDPDYNFFDYLTLKIRQNPTAKAVLTKLVQNAVRRSETTMALDLAAGFGLIDSVNGLLANYTQHNFVEDYKTLGDPLHLASRNGHVNIVKSLLAAKAAVNIRTRGDKTTLLTVAAYFGHIEVVCELIEAKADTTLINNSGLTAIGAAARNGHLNIVTLLFTKNANINPVNGEALIFTAARYGRTEVVKFLSNKKADVNRSDIKGMTPLLIACQNGHSATVQTLINFGADVNRAASNGDTPLSLACNLGLEAMVDSLLSAGAHINRETNAGKTPLEIAQEIQHTAITAKLESLGALPHQLSKTSFFDLRYDELTLIFRSLSLEDFVSCIAVCKQWQINLDTDLFWQIQFNFNFFSYDYDVDRLLSTKDQLIENYKKCNADSADRKIFFSACKRLDLEVIKKLLAQEQPFSLLSFDNLNHTALDYIIRIIRKYPSMKSVLADLYHMQHKKSYKDEFVYAAVCGMEKKVCDIMYRDFEFAARFLNTVIVSVGAYGYVEIAKALIAMGANVNHKDSSGKTAIMRAALNNIPEIIAQFIAAGANVNITDGNRWTTITYAAYGGNAEIVAQLIKARADVNIVTKQGWTPLMYACARGQTEIVSLLNAAGAKLTLVNKNGKTALHLACQQGHTEVVKLLSTSILNNLIRTRTLSFYGKTTANAPSRLLAFIENNSDQSTLNGVEQVIKTNREMKIIYDYCIAHPEMNNKKYAILKKYMSAKAKNNIAEMLALERQALILLSTEKNSLEANVVYAIIQVHRQKKSDELNKFDATLKTITALDPELNEAIKLLSHYCEKAILTTEYGEFIKQQFNISQPTPKLKAI